ncbi:MAG: hypothetical protein GXO50_08795, partial [Chlorobi bacterium]|nr:hypothetical protein [Chlorobiota bacterium]
MRKLLFTTILLFFAIFTEYAQNNKTEIISSKNNEIILKITFNSFKTEKVKTPEGDAIIITAENTNPVMIKGAPDLPEITESIIISDTKKMKLEIISETFKDLDGTYKIAPSKGNFGRNINPSNIPYKYGEIYKKNSFFPEKTAKLGKPYIIRDYRGQTLNIFPVKYNPVSKKLRIYSEITVKISETEQTGKNILNKKNKKSIIPEEFDKIYSQHFINYKTNTKYTPLTEEGKMLIICNDAWTSAMEPFVKWKNKIGRPAEMVTVTDAGGTADAIKTYVENYYNTNGLTYLLLVGDAEQVPTNNGSGLGGDSDNAYGYISGDDHYQEIFVGRFSAESEDDVLTQVQRTITYEDGSTLDSDWLNKTTGIASDQGPGDDNEYDYEHVRNMQTDLIGFTYVEPTIELFDGSQGGNDANDNPSASDVAASMNSGTGIITYTGHGDDTYWVTSGFGVNDVNNLTNENKLPFIFDVACVNGNFVGQTCFGESLLRAQNNGNPTGAIAICASTINQSWAPPMIAQDEMVDLLANASANGIKRTFAGLVVNGMFQMLDESSDNNMADTWTTFGDPSLMVRTDNPEAMAVSHDAVLIMGVSDFTVNCNFDGALACISRDGEIIGTEHVSGGSAIVPVSGVTPGDVLDVVVTGFNKITYQGQVTVTAPSGPYIVLDSYDLSGDHSINFGQTNNINITLKNVGADDATNITASLSTSDAAVTAMNNNTNISFGNIAADNTASVSGQFEITVSDNIEDQYVIPFTLTITDGTDTWESNFNVTVNAPEITIGNVFVSNDDNSDGRLDPGETGDI